MNDWRCCAVIPVYNHGGPVGTVVRAVREQGLDCILVDDGSEAGCAAILDALVAADQGVRLVRLAVNQGKGGAMMAGLRAAQAAGFTHALQIDADGQHDTSDLPVFLSASAAAPTALICGHPVYDDSVPRSRFYGRYATHIWVWINTLSLDIRDSMCGYRIYPLGPTIDLFNRVRMGRRMDFDTEVLVRLHWQGMRIVNQPTRVRYAADGVSHFRLWRDNALISSMHARLFLGMLWRAPRLLARRWQT